MTSWNLLKSSVLSTDKIRKVDRVAVEQFGMHSLVLMENAAVGCVNWLEGRFAQPLQITILCGRGNNGGDGLAMARHLQTLGWICNVFVFGPESKLSRDNCANLIVLRIDNDIVLEVVERTTDAIRKSIQNADVVVDAMLGTGATGDPRPPLVEWIEEANASSAFQLAIDVPTGICAETGKRGTPAFQADATLTFVARKPAMVLDAAPQKFGEIVVLPIGIPESLIRDVLTWT